ncbi:hypothetical protein GWI33_017114 [Rhynchophorus ferrugineus]|uniref:Uncharacterized protein n=1 Tax=Rhynchophorus ferrugineus TaxID=354439 RepID=A0A834HXC4_RHYFE|nr:hypothetical protein GWI33_017114 [Rhynchophorus ferrugineus]
MGFTRVKFAIAATEDTRTCPGAFGNSPATAADSPSTNTATVRHEEPSAAEWRSRNVWSHKRGPAILRRLGNFNGLLKLQFLVYFYFYYRKTIKWSCKSKDNVSLQLEHKVTQMITKKTCKFTNMRKV